MTRFYVYIRKEKKLPRKILLLEHHKHAQLECARNHCEWLVEWKTLAFSDERKKYFTGFNSILTI